MNQSGQGLAVHRSQSPAILLCAKGHWMKSELSALHLKLCLLKREAVSGGALKPSRVKLVVLQKLGKQELGIGP